MIVVVPTGNVYVPTAPVVEATVVAPLIEYDKVVLQLSLTVGAVTATDAEQLPASLFTATSAAGVIVGAVLSTTVTLMVAWSILFASSVAVTVTEIGLDARSAHVKVAERL